MAKQVFRAGNLQTFENRIKRYKDKGASFTVRSGGLSRRIQIDGSSKVFRFFGHPSSSFVDGSWFAPMVRRDIDRYISENGRLSVFDKPDIQQFCVDRIQDNLGKPITGVDMNNCHWTTAYLLGFISEHLYKRGIASGKKKGLLVSIGSLNKMERIDRYENGDLVHSDYDHETHEVYSPFYWAIIGRVRDVMMDVFATYEDAFYMWLTDCAFVDPVAAPHLQEHFRELGYQSKRYDVDFTNVTHNKVCWYDSKYDSHKQIAYLNRDIETSYALWEAGAKSREGLATPSP